MAASGDGAFSSSSPMDRLLRGISMPYEVPSVERRLLMNPPSSSRKKKEGFAGAALRMLGCASEAASQAYDPSVSKNKTPGRRRKTKKEGRRIHGGGKISCAPVTPSSTEASLAGRKLLDASEQSPSSCRRENHQETLSNPNAPLLGHDRVRSEYLHRSPGFHPTPYRSEEIIMFQTIVQLGELEVYEQYQDQWLDVDNMSYEELLELGDKIGQVNTGLEEEQIMSSLRKVKYSFLDALKRHIRSHNEPNCIICQEEYSINDAIGELQCGHRYHVRCIKRWLLQKNACPVCKTAVSTQAFESR
ncbi:probable E3 ubiquitin-protein ligase ZFP1 isoform X2 [Zingiber officinale]|uniref:probable E3 ubiquitin-protein ligase ZFP1 isoform X2 n=1 Tax=Zingiber officinale TaxID=94328 RepID=UPI001C4DAB4A|nr:probable E3 ubiquitin-protein ligase ZFP1 isoform X2 [Zingiber officinale]